MIEVYNLSTGEVFSYIGNKFDEVNVRAFIQSRIKALINCYFYSVGLFPYNDLDIIKAKSLIVLGKDTASINDFCVKLR